MRNSPERLAWVVLATAFGTFCLLSILIPAGVRWYIINATQPFSTEATSVRGTVLVGNPVAELSSSLTDGSTITVEESFAISTDDTSQALLTFFDDSSLTMYSNTSITLEETREPRFSISSNPTRIVIDVEQGRVRATSSRSQEDLSFDIITPHAFIELDQGSFSIEVSEEETQVTTRLGQANVIGNERTITLRQSQRALVGPNSPLQGPLPAAQNLLSDSNFNPSFEESWDAYTYEPIPGVSTAVTVDNFEGRHVLRFTSQGEDNIHTETGVTQEVNKDVRDFQSLQVFAEVRLIDQSLPGGGQLGSEFPIMLRLDYKDADDNDRSWYHGFYYLPPPENYVIINQPDNSAERIARFIWYPYESNNLLTTLGPAKPVFIKSIRIYASGWIYDAMVANISLLAQE